jgi:hypothetical protein
VQYAFIAFPLILFWLAPEGIIIVPSGADFEIVPIVG